MSSRRTARVSPLLTAGRAQVLPQLDQIEQHTSLALDTHRRVQ
jgi:hypothetical protein